jgi:hypothetical protein
MSNVHVMGRKPNPEWERMALICEEWAARWRAGEVRQGCFMGTSPSGDWFASLSIIEDRYQWIGALEGMKYDLLDVPLSTTIPKAGPPVGGSAEPPDEPA